MTYRLPPDQPADFAPLGRVKQELSTQDWLQIVDKAWVAGIPHIIFTGGEPTLRQDLPELLSQIEQNGQVSGLISNGTGFGDPGYLDKLLNTGLDHLMLVLHPEQDISREGINLLLSADLYTAVHLTLTPASQGIYLERIRELAQLGIQAISLTTADPALAGP